MAFATEAEVRKEAFLEDSEWVPSEQLLESLNRAHEEILTDTVLTDETVPTETIIRAEATLALSHWFRSQAISASTSAKDIRIAGTRIDGPARVKHLGEISMRLAEEAWMRLKPFLKNAQPVCALRVEGEES